MPHGRSTETFSRTVVLNLWVSASSCTSLSQNTYTAIHNSNKLQLWSSNKSNFMSGGGVGGTKAWGTVSKDRIVALGSVGITALKSAESWALVAHTFNPSTREAEAGRFLRLRPAWSTEWVPGQKRQGSKIEGTVEWENDNIKTRKPEHVAVRRNHRWYPTWYKREVGKELSE